MATLEELTSRVADLESTISSATGINPLPEKASPTTADSLEISDPSGTSFRITLARVLNHNSVDRTISQTISQFQVLKLPQTIPADKDEIDIGSQLLAVALLGGVLGDVISVLFTGVVTNNNWNWNTALPIFLDTSGGMTQTAPTTGTSWILGKPIDTISMYFRPKDPVIL